MTERARLARRLVVPLAALAAAAAPASAQEAPPGGCTADETAVYTVVLDSLYRNVPRTRYLVADSTAGQILFGAGRRDLVEEVMRGLRDLPAAVTDDYVSRNERRRRLGPGCFRTRVPVALLGPLAAEVFGAAGDDGYPDTLPARGQLSLSAIGFSPDGSAAALHVVFGCGGRCGDGQVIVLGRARGRWRVARTERTITF